MKAFRQEDGGVSLFRPEKNAERMIQSAKRMVMDPVPKDWFLESLHALIGLEKRFVPKSKGTALYIRPTEIATEAFLGVRSAKEYLYYVILCSVGPYFSEGFKPVKIFVETKYIRAAIGGTGEAKTGGNYAASLLGLINAHNAGCKQVMWLDAKEHKYIEEVGTMNQFFVIDDTIVTPELSGTILEGITRESVIKLAKDNGYQVEERPITIDEIVDGIEKGKVTEAFGSGTAASIAPVGELVYKNKNYIINDNKVGVITKQLYDLITGIQYGRIEDPYGWNVRIKE
jgi:branched-chain amino acid aminotransferase